MRTDYTRGRRFSKDDGRKAGLCSRLEVAGHLLKNLGGDGVQAGPDAGGAADFRDHALAGRGRQVGLQSGALDEGVADPPEVWWNARG